MNNNKDGVALEVLYGAEAVETFEIFYRFKQAGLIELFESALAIYDKNPKVTKFFFENWKKTTKEKEYTGKQPEYDDYEDNLHKMANDAYSIKIDEEDPNAWEFIKFEDVDKIVKNARKFKESILRILKIKKLNQKKLATLMGVSDQAVSQFFRFDKPPRPTTLQKLKNALKLTGVFVHHPDLGSNNTKGGRLKK